MSTRYGQPSLDGVGGPQHDRDCLFCADYVCATQPSTAQKWIGDAELPTA
eukprot:CAMPEP_0175652610 /NCGR_PEP_ID=MMETSP0097-20121207/10457_1 /TAXON_ID=311494 /ORGANISM="Alexandrium monilatum, Strain CCMP3105" /LENGTH=49 /DNA_ID= /DNA_START= /DNA_END= /DNA_ORIENTATION=